VASGRRARGSLISPSGVCQSRYTVVITLQAKNTLASLQAARYRQRMENRRDHIIQIRVSAAERERYLAVAMVRRKTLSEIIRAALDQRARRDAGKEACDDA